MTFPGPGSYEQELLDAATIGDIQKIISLIEVGVDINAKDKKGETALFKAAIHCQTNTVIFLLKKGSDIDTRDNDGQTILSRVFSLESNRLINNNFQQEHYSRILQILRLSGATRF